MQIEKLQIYVHVCLYIHIYIYDSSCLNKITQITFKFSLLFIMYQFSQILDNFRKLDFEQVKDCLWIEVTGLIGLQDHWVLFNIVYNICIVAMYNSSLIRCSIDFVHSASLQGNYVLFHLAHDITLCVHNVKLPHMVIY